MRSKSEKVNITTEFYIFKLEENNYIFLAAFSFPFLATFSKQHLFGATHLVRTYLMTDARIYW